MRARSDLALGIAALLLLGGCASTTERRGLPPLETVEQLDLQRYLGTWYEIASYPQRFQQGCTGTTAHYALKPDGEITVTNRCRAGSLEGEEKVSVGRARVVDPKTRARLEVSFFGPFWGDYWVIQLDPDYQFAVVGHPGRDYLWILGRTPVMSEEVYAGILRRLESQGYELARLHRTLQPGGPPATPTP
ncbi:MAG: lipocalin family protein [Myxococcota bacterium]|nr:lipocalin family protein [Myxococcota bacterium]